MRFAVTLLIFSAFLFAPAIVLAAERLSEEQTQLKRNERLVGLCNRTGVKYVPSADVEYKPGIDAKGNFIVAADLDATLGPEMYPLRIPIEVDIVERFDLDVPLGIISDPEVAGIMVFEDGRVTYNGKEVSDKVEVFCIENKIIEGPKATEQPTPLVNTPASEEEPSAKEVGRTPAIPAGEPIEGEYH